MAHAYRSPSALLLAAMVTGISLLSLSMVAYSYPLSEMRSGDNSNRATQGNGFPGRLNRSSSDFNQRSGFAVNSFRESNQFLDGSDVKWAGMIGLGAIASLATVRIIYRVCCKRRSAHPSDDVLLQYPELEHPELTLTSIPKEAFSSFSVDRDVVLANSSKTVH